jgi:hypothetical protein
MNRLVFESYLLLIKIEWLMHSANLQSVHVLLCRSEVAASRSRSGPSVEDLCHAVDLACVFYPKGVLCLQRSAATTLILRRYGHKAEFVIGAQILPFKSHAWVEIDGAVVNDKPYMLEIYQVLERC